MDSKAIMSNVAVAVITAILMGALAFFAGVFERGAEAMTEDQIEAVIERVLVTDTGDTHAAALANINTNLTAIDTKVGMIKDDVDKLEEAVRELTQ